MPEQTFILLADDSQDDILLVRKALANTFITHQLAVVRDGEEALAYLKAEGKYSDRDEYPLPDLLLLDLKMPRMDGFEVLQWIRQQPGLRNLVVVVLTASDQIRDVNKAYRLGANSFLVKPMDFQNFSELTRGLAGYWLQLNRAPQTSREPKQPQAVPQDPPV